MSILAKIIAAKRRELEGFEIELSGRSDPIRSLHAALSTPPTRGPVHAIAEFKRASPSAGPIRADAEPEAVCAAYQKHGASAISVLTDVKFFDGRLEFLARARTAAPALPILRKDFIIDERQVLEAHNRGADAILLIVAALDDSALARLHGAATELGLDCLVEIHSEAEAARALEAGARIIGVNHRDLRTFEIDLSLTERLRPMVCDDVVLVAESGIRFRSDLERVAAAGASAVLVGEHLMRAPSPGLALAELLG